MEAKEMELFKETDFNGMKTFIKKYDEWYLFDNIRERKDFSYNTSNRYIAACKIGKPILGIPIFSIFFDDSYETRVLEKDKQAKLIGMGDYLKLAYFMRLNGNYIYNKRKGKLELKNGKG